MSNTNKVPQEEYTPSNLGVYIFKHPNISFFSTIFCSVSAIILFAMYILPNIGSLFSLISRAFSSSIIWGIIFTSILISVLMIAGRSVLRNFDGLLITIVSLQISSFLVLSESSTFLSYLEMSMDNFDDFDYKVRLYNPALLWYFVILPFDGFYDEFFHALLLFIAISGFGRIIYKMFLWLLEYFVIYSAPNWLIRLTNSAREFRLGNSKIWRAARDYNNYFIGYFAFLRGIDQDQSPEEETDFLSDSKDLAFGGIIECRNCGAKNRIKQFLPNGLYKCSACKEPLTTSELELFNENEEKNASHEELIKRYCAILGINATSNVYEIKQAYRKIIKQYHPDRFAGLGKSLEEEAHRRAVEINTSYQRLISLVAFA